MHCIAFTFSNMHRTSDRKAPDDRVPWDQLTEYEKRNKCIAYLMSTGNYHISEYGCIIRYIERCNTILREAEQPLFDTFTKTGEKSIGYPVPFHQNLRLTDYSGEGNCVQCNIGLRHTHRLECNIYKCNAISCSDRCALRHYNEAHKNKPIPD